MYAISRSFRCRSQSFFSLYLACSVVCFQWHKLSLDKVYDSIIVRGWQVLLPVAFNANIELYPLPFPLSPLSTLRSFSLPFSLLLLSLVLVFIATVVVAVSGAWQFIALAIAVHIQPSILLSVYPSTNQVTKQPSIQLPICSISAPLCVGVGVLESCILTGQREVCCWIILLYFQRGEL